MTAKFRPPAGDEVKEVLRRIPTTQLRRAFFEGLNNPEWVVPLATEGVFDNPPEPVKTDDGLVRDIYWPEIDYLIRMAAYVPEAVVDVLLKLHKSNNAWVKRACFAVGATIPADQAARLAPLLRSWKSRGFGWRTDPRDLVAFTINLFQGGEVVAGTWLANVIFKPHNVSSGRRSENALEAYWYRQGLPNLVAVLGDDGLGLVLPWLVSYERAHRNLTKQFDMTYFWRDSVRSGSDEREDIEQVLIDAVRDLAVRAMLVDPSTAKHLLLGTNMLLARKVALFSLGAAIRQIGDSQRMKRFLSVATELLFDEQSSHDSCRIDYAELARAVAQASPDSLDPLTEFIDLGSRAGDDDLRERIRSDGRDEAEVDEVVQEYEERWKHRWLSAIGVEALPPPLGAELATLDSRYGVIDQPLVPTPRITSWVGPNSPVSQEEMAGMSPTELISHLESWHDTGNGWGPEPSHEGQARELTALMTTNPEIVAGISDLVGRLRPTYVRAILRGWEAAIKSDLVPEWNQVAEVVADVLRHDDASAFPAEGGRGDDDPDFRWAKRAAVGLLEHLVQKREVLTMPEETMARFAEMLVTSAVDETAWLEYVSDAAGSGMDPLTVSLNWQWPIGVRGLVNLVSQGRETSWYESARSALETELSRPDPIGASRAVIGRSLGRLLSADPEWLKPRIPELFGAEAGLSVAQQIALTTAVASHHYHPTLYKLLSPSMIAAIVIDEPIVAGWRTQIEPLQQIGAWAIRAITLGHNTIDDPVARAFFTAAPPKVRGDSLGHIAWSFMHAPKVDDPIRDRLAELWDSRVAHVRVHPEDRDELNDFYWFVKSNKFAVQWWLPRLREALELCPELGAERYMIGKEIALSADIDPRNAFEVMKLLLSGRDEAGMTVYDLTRNAVPMVIARCMTSGDESLKQEAEMYMNELGEAGNLTLQAEVTKFLAGVLGEGDVDE